MIKHHPSDELLLAHAGGELPASMTIAVAAHCEMCDTCAEKVAQYEITLSDSAFDETLNVETSESDSAVFATMMAAITRGDITPVTKMTASPEAHIDVAGERYTLPVALRRYYQLGWSSVGSISRARLPLNEGDTRASLLHIGMNGTVPSHTHKGMELTLLLSGHFEDEKGTYVPGDFIILDGSTNHTPHTHDGCLCYTVADAPLHFTKGVSQLLNAVGRVIY
ncbi:ChrR family anti-sigma-E factor [Enterovibrio paralichthyis]|uniref:ChrR family anti-sigma-E factor n=1 Tax=Enterovibrio paralichthyis TaxID=2853805 RepID=UPI001C466643|nr:ChrR family anti-sigma-E factor [Enterovibrio paralichthyis]MBV7299729.1 ChrR family anti-sigma-E factor [Enterovibrio paralichthyis]